VWHLGIVLLDVERNEGSEAFDGIQRVEVQPLVLERTPERLNRAATVHARIFRQKLSMVAGIYARVPSSSLMTLVSTRQVSLGCAARTPNGRLRWMTAVSRTPPAMLADELGVVSENSSPSSLLRSNSLF